MSDALNYLMKVRPEAMQSYFDFVKKSGKHLDKKTRALISVITKVDNQTETGFKQYLSRALQGGATADEIIDALFAAFPILGLSKIIWAIDIIIELDVPEFRPEMLGGNPPGIRSWHLTRLTRERHGLNVTIVNSLFTVKKIWSMSMTAIARTRSPIFST